MRDSRLSWAKVLGRWLPGVGAQPYFKAEATMLLHTRGILVMTPDSTMVLTGKQALDYSGGVSAEGNVGIGGYDRIMGPNGQAQYWATDLTAACEIRFAHYEHTYVAPGERFPRRAATTDPVDRDVRSSPHYAPNSDFRVVSDIFSMETNPERKKAFDIRAVMRAVADQDHQPLERWAAIADAESVVVFDAHVGGYPVTVLGIESRPLRRSGFLPADGPDQARRGRGRVRPRPYRRPGAPCRFDRCHHRPIASGLTSSRRSSGGCGKQWSDLYRRRTLADHERRPARPP